MTRPSASSVRIDECSEDLPLLDRRVFVDVSVAMHSARVEKEWLELGKEFMRMIYLVEGKDAAGKRLANAIRLGLFRSEYPVKRSELLFTSVLAAKLCKIVPRLVDREAQWLHQVPERSDGKVDICLYLEDGSTIWAPVCFFEFGLNCASRQKCNQAIAYSVNLSPQLLPGHVGLDIEIILSATDHSNNELGWMRVYGFRLVEGRKVGFANVWQGPLTVESISRLLSSIEIVARCNFAPLTPNLWQRVKNSSFDQDFVWKVFDYRDRQVHAADRRSPQFSLKFIPGCLAILEATDLTLIRYPRIPGSHTPQAVCQWISVIKSVQGFHAASIVHGDLRASNIIFHSDKKEATIIDFDLAGANEEKIYPMGFNTKINDGARARSASGGRPLLFAHDWYAIGAMMKLCVLEDGEQQDWAEACQLLGGVNPSAEDVAKAVDLLEKCRNVSIKSLKWKSEENPGTGSPERNPEKKS